MRLPDSAVQPRTEIEDLRRAELVAATLRVVSAQGFDRTTVRDIARVAHASVGSVNYYFKSKDDLVRAAVAETDARFRRKVLAAVAEAGDHATKLARVVELCFPVATDADSPDWAVFLDFWYQASRHESYRVIFDEAHLEWIEMLTKTMADGAKAGAFRLTGPPRDEALRFAALIDGLALYTRVTRQVDTLAARRIAGEYIESLRPLPTLSAGRKR
jgi:AcrR family transcriptional regulator